MDCLLARDNDSTILSSWTKLTLLLPHQDNVDAFFWGGGAEGGVSKDSSLIQMKFVSWTPSFPGIFLRVLPCLAPLWSKSPMNIQSENWAGRSDLRRKCIAFVLPNWKSFSWPNCSSLKSRVSFVRNSSQFGRSDAFCLKTARSGRPVVTNGERPWIDMRLTNLSTIEGRLNNRYTSHLEVYCFERCIMRYQSWKFIRVRESNLVWFQKFQNWLISLFSLSQFNYHLKQMIRKIKQVKPS